MSCIGGYFGFEPGREGKGIHGGARLALRSGRASFRCLLEAERPALVRVPYFACDALFEPLAATATPFEYYEIGPNMEVAAPWPPLRANERLIHVNYFGLQAAHVTSLEERYGGQLWVDQTQAFFECPVNARSCHFNSARKFFGVPDGAYLYAPETIPLPAADFWARNANYRVDHLILREQGKAAEGYEAFQENERLCGGDIARMSTLSESLLSRIDFDAAATRRRANFLHLNDELGGDNRLSSEVTALADDAVPFCYPYLPPRPIEQKYFWDREIFVPILWRECLTRATDGFEWEKKLSAELLPLPIDHRYGPREMDQILQAIRSHES